MQAVQSKMQSLTARMEKVETVPKSSSAFRSQNSAPQDILALTGNLFGNPSITAVPSNVQYSHLDLVNKNILRARITSVRIRSLYL